MNILYTTVLMSQLAIGSILEVQVVDDIGKPITGATVESTQVLSHESNSKQGAWSEMKVKHPGTVKKSKLETNADGKVAVDFTAGIGLLVCAEKPSDKFMNSCQSGRSYFLSGDKTAKAITVALKKGAVVAVKPTAEVSSMTKSSHFSLPGLVLGVRDDKGRFIPATLARNGELVCLVEAGRKYLFITASSSSFIFEVEAEGRRAVGKRAVLELPILDSGSRFEVSLKQNL